MSRTDRAPLAEEGPHAEGAWPSDDAPDSLEQKDDTTRGLYEKFYVARTDGRSATGQKHEGCRYFVLDLTHDLAAPAALRAYAAVVENRHPALAADLRREAGPAESRDYAALVRNLIGARTLRYRRAAEDATDGSFDFPGAFAGQVFKIFEPVMEEGVRDAVALCRELGFDPDDGRSL